MHYSIFLSRKNRNRTRRIDSEM